MLQAGIFKNMFETLYRPLAGTFFRHHSWNHKATVSINNSNSHIPFFCLLENTRNILSSMRISDKQYLRKSFFPVHQDRSLPEFDVVKNATIQPVLLKSFNLL